MQVSEGVPISNGPKEEGFLAHTPHHHTCKKERSREDTVQIHILSLTAWDLIRGLPEIHTKHRLAVFFKYIKLGNFENRLFLSLQENFWVHAGQDIFLESHLKTDYFSLDMPRLAKACSVDSEQHIDILSRY